MVTRNSYDTFLISLYIQGKDHLIPKEIHSQIPSSTLSDFRRRNPEHYFGSELRSLQKEMLDHHELMLKYVQLKKILVVITSVWISFAKAGAFALLRKKELRTWLTDQVQRLSEVMPKTTAIRLSGLSPSSFAYSLRQMKHNCGLSSLNLCFKRHPLQLSFAEVNTIKNLMCNPKFICWPASSIFHYAKREKLLLISQSTFYKYLNVLGLSKKYRFKPRAKNGIKANRPNQFLHVDTTFWTISSGQKIAIVFVSDNFSRHILGYSVSLTHGFKNVKTALIRAVETIRKYYPQHFKTHIITDGGGENNALEIEQFIASTKSPDLIKWIAKKDIVFSNSPVEAINKIFKRYLRHFQPQDYPSFLKCVEYFISDYTQTRPHGSLNGFTPVEAYISQSITNRTDYSKDIARAREQRLLANQKTNCSNCSLNPHKKESLLFFQFHIKQTLQRAHFQFFFTSYFLTISFYPPYFL